MARPSRVVQPGPVQRPRIVAVEGRGRAFVLRLKAGLSLIEAVAQGFAAEGFISGVLNFESLAVRSLSYVMPALPKDEKNVAFYSDTYRPGGVTQLQRGALTFGKRDGAPFFHCHALWHETDGKLSGGHILPDETIIAEAASVRAFGIDGALFNADADPETNFKLFGPVTVPASGAARDQRAFALRVRPNECLHGALEAFVRDQGMVRAKVRGGVGSTIGAKFADGRLVENFATEVFISDGEIALDTTGALRAKLEAGLVDYTGALAEGLLERGSNPVLITFELIISEG